MLRKKELDYIKHRCPKNTLKTSAKMALAMGIFLPLAETVRRINQILDPSEFFSWFDDYILGGTLLLAAYMVFKNKVNANAYLIAAWGIGVGALFLSFLSQMKRSLTDTLDPGIFENEHLNEQSRQDRSFYG